MQTTETILTKGADQELLDKLPGDTENFNSLRTHCDYCDVECDDPQKCGANRAAAGLPVEEQSTGQLKTKSRCQMCGRELTDPSSISRGIGPECIKKVETGQHSVRYLRLGAVDWAQSASDEALRAENYHPASVRHAAKTIKVKMDAGKSLTKAQRRSADYLVDAHKSQEAVE